MTISPLVLCNNFLYRGFRDRCEITPMKLQKLMYFLCRDYLQKYETPLINELFSVWQYGPVLESVYGEFKPFRAKPINQYAKDAQGKSMMLDERACPELTALLDGVWEKYKHHSGIALSRLTHRPESAWYQAYQNHHPVISYEDMLNDRVS